MSKALSYEEYRSRDLRESDSNHPGDYLVVGDEKVKSSWRLPVKRNGTPDHHLMGAAYQSLHGGYRGNTYEGPDKREAVKKLKALYEAEKMPWPGKDDQPVHVEKGGPGSGFFGHAGRPGLVGGSAADDTAALTADEAEARQGDDEVEDLRQLEREMTGEMTFTPADRDEFPEGTDAWEALNAGYRIALNDRGMIVDIWDPKTGKHYDVFGEELDGPYHDQASTQEQRPMTDTARESMDYHAYRLRKGGPGSGFHGHSGQKGQRGGSAHSAGKPPSPEEQMEQQERGGDPWQPDEPREGVDIDGDGETDFTYDEYKMLKARGFFGQKLQKARGFFGHKGRPGQHGGSLPRSEGLTRELQTDEYDEEQDHGEVPADQAEVKPDTETGENVITDPDKIDELFGGETYAERATATDATPQAQADEGYWSKFTNWLGNLYPGVSVEDVYKVMLELPGAVLPSFAPTPKAPESTPKEPSPAIAGPQGLEPVGEMQGEPGLMQQVTSTLVDAPYEALIQKPIIEPATELYTGAKKVFYPDQPFGPGRSSADYSLMGERDPATGELTYEEAPIEPMDLPPADLPREPEPSVAPDPYAPLKLLPRTNAPAPASLDSEAKAIQGQNEKSAKEQQKKTVAKQNVAAYARDEGLAVNEEPDGTVTISGTGGRPLTFASYEDAEEYVKSQEKTSTAAEKKPPKSSGTKPPAPAPSAQPQPSSPSRPSVLMRSTPSLPSPSLVLPEQSRQAPEAGPEPQPAAPVTPSAPQAPGTPTPTPEEIAQQEAEAKLSMEEYASSQGLTIEERDDLIIISGPNFAPTYFESYAQAQEFFRQRARMYGYEEPMQKMVKAAGESDANALKALLDDAQQKNAQVMQQSGGRVIVFMPDWNPPHSGRQFSSAAEAQNWLNEQWNASQQTKSAEVANTPIATLKQKGMAYEEYRADRSQC